MRVLLGYAKYRKYRKCRETESGTQPPIQQNDGLRIPITCLTNPTSNFTYLLLEGRGGFARRLSIPYRPPRAIWHGYHFWNHAVNTPISAGSTELMAPTKLAASVCMMKYVQMGATR